MKITIKQKNIAGVCEWLTLITCLAIVAFACAVAWDIVWRAGVVIFIAIFMSKITSKYVEQ